MIPNLIIERENFKSQSLTERESKLNRKRGSNKCQRVILTIISIRDRDGNNSKCMNVWISSSVCKLDNQIS